MAARDLMKDDNHTPLLVDFHIDRVQLANLEELGKGMPPKPKKAKVMSFCREQQQQQQQQLKREYFMLVSVNLFVKM